MGPYVPLLAACLLGAPGTSAPAASPLVLFSSAGPGGGGAISVPSISPHDSALLFVASDPGGVWRSADGGANWTMIDKRQLRDAAGMRMVWHPVFGGWIYGCGGSVLKMSKDAGLTWKPMCPSQPWGGEPVTAFAVDEADTKIMFAGTTFGVFRSRNGGLNWEPCPGVRGRVLGIHVDPTTPPGNRIIVAGTTEGVFRSSDSGSVWRDSGAGLPSRQLRSFCGSGNAQSGKVAFYCTVPSRAAGKQFEGGVFRSLDHGTTWQTAMGTGINAGVSRVDGWGSGDVPQYGLVDSPLEAPYTLYVTAAGTGYWPPNHDTVYRTDDGGATWRACVFGDPRGEASGIRANIVPGWITADHVWSRWNGVVDGLAVDDHYPDHAIFANGGELYQTRDGGGTWTQAYSRVATTLRVEATPGVSADAETPRVPADAGTPPPWPKEGARWASTGLDAASCWEVAFDPHRPGRVLVCSSVSGLEASEDGGATWRWAPGGSPWRNTFYQLAFDPAAPGVVWAACSDQGGIPQWAALEGPRGSGGVCASRDGGMTWTPSGRGLPEAPVTSVVLDPRSPATARVLYAASFGRGIFRSADGGRSWAATPGQPGREGNRHVWRLLVQPDGALYCTVTGCRKGSAFPVPGGLWRSRDGGATWEELTASLKPLWPGDAVVHPADSNTIWLGLASVPGRGDGGVYRTNDGGRTWKKVLGEEYLPQELAPSAHALFLSQDPRAPDTLYAGITTHGLFVTHDAGKTWAEVKGIPFAGCRRVTPDPANPGTVWVTTSGGGVWRGPTP